MKDPRVTIDGDTHDVDSVERKVIKRMFNKQSEQF